MLTKVDERKPKKRRQPQEEGGGGGETKRKKGGEQGQKAQGDGGKTRLDALSVGYFRRVGERLTEGFDDDEEKGWGFIFKSLSIECIKIFRVLPIKIQPS